MEGKYPNVAFIGQLRNGKTTAANWLVDNAGYRRYAFAAEVKRISGVLLNTFLDEVGNDTQYVSLTTLEARKSEPAVRTIMQVVGTEIGRVFFKDPDVWVRLLAKQLDAECGPVVIDDCRFPNEEQMLRERGFRFVRVVRPGFTDVLYRDIAWANPSWTAIRVEEEIERILNHPSEAYVSEIECDAAIEAETVEELYAKVRVEFSDIVGKE